MIPLSISTYIIIFLVLYKCWLLEGFTVQVVQKIKYRVIHSSNGVVCAKKFFLIKSFITQLCNVYSTLGITIEIKKRRLLLAFSNAITYRFFFYRCWKRRYRMYNIYLYTEKNTNNNKPNDISRTL